MPQKSTFFYPKVLTGLTIHTLEPIAPRRVALKAIGRRLLARREQLSAGVVGSACLASILSVRVATGCACVV